MKKHLHLSILLLLFFTWSGCKKEMLDFSHLNKAEVSGEWGIPILNTTITAEDILAQMSENNYVFPNANGQLFLTYVFDETRVVTDAMLLSFSDESEKYEWKKTLSGSEGTSFSKDTTFLFKIPDNRITVGNGVVMHGALVLKVSGNVGPIIISCKNLKNASGENFMRTNFTGGTIDLSGYSLNFKYEDNNTLELQVIIGFQETGGAKEYSMNLDVSTQMLRLREATGKVKTFTGDWSTVLDIGTASNNNRFGGSATLYNPKVTLHVKNGFNQLGGEAFIDTLHFLGQNKSSNILTTYPSSMLVSGGMDAGQPIQGLSAVYYSSDFDKLKFAGHVVVNSQSEAVFVQNNSALDVKGNVEIPFELKSESVFYQDTLDFNIGTNTPNLPDIIQSIVFRCVIGNSLPFNVKGQLYFYDSKQKVITDSLFIPPLLLAGAFQEGKMKETPFPIEIEQNRIDKVMSADKIILRFNIDTENRKVFVNAKHGLKVTLGVKIKYEKADVFNVFNNFSNN